MLIEMGEFITPGETRSGDIQAALLTAIARSTEDLSNGRGWPDGVNALLADLGRITKVSRVWIFQVLELTRDYYFRVGRPDLSAGRGRSLQR